MLRLIRWAMSILIAVAVTPSTAQIPQHVGQVRDPFALMLSGMVSGQFKRLDSTAVGDRYVDNLTPRTRAVYDCSFNSIPTPTCGSVVNPDPFATDADVVGSVFANQTAGSALAYSYLMGSTIDGKIAGFGGGHGIQVDDIMTFDTKGAVQAALDKTAPPKWTVAMAPGALMNMNDARPSWSHEASAPKTGAPWYWTTVDNVHGYPRNPSCHTYGSAYWIPGTTKLTFGGGACSSQPTMAAGSAEIYDDSTHTSIICYSPQTSHTGGTVTQYGFAQIISGTYAAGAIAYDDHDGRLYSTAAGVLGFHPELDVWPANFLTCGNGAWTSPLTSVRLNAAISWTGVPGNGNSFRIVVYQDPGNANKRNIFQYRCSGNSIACPDGNAFAITDIEGATAGVQNIQYVHPTACDTWLADGWDAWGEARSIGAVLRWAGDGHIWKITASTDFRAWTCTDLERSYSGDIPTHQNNISGKVVIWLPQYPAIILSEVDDTDNTVGVWLLKP